QKIPDRCGVRSDPQPQHGPPLQADSGCSPGRQHRRLAVSLGIAWRTSPRHRACAHSPRQSGETQMKRERFPIARLAYAAGAIAAGLVLGAISVNAAQPVIPTPAGTIRLPNIVYVIPYAVSASPAGVTAQAETIVSINATGAAAPCVFQVEWV